MSMRACLSALAGVAALTIISSAAKADLLSYNLNGIFPNDPFGPAPLDAPAAGTAFTATLTYHSDGSARTDPNYSYYTDYMGALDSLTVSFGGQQLSTATGSITFGTGPNGNTLLDIAAAPSNLFIDSTQINIFAIALRALDGTAVPSGPGADLSLYDLRSSNLYIESYSGYQSVGYFTSEAQVNAVPVPASLSLLLSGLAAMAFARTVRKTVPSA